MPLNCRQVAIEYWLYALHFHILHISSLMSTSELRTFPIFNASLTWASSSTSLEFCAACR